MKRIWAFFCQAKNEKTSLEGLGVLKSCELNSEANVKGEGEKSEGNGQVEVNKTIQETLMPPCKQGKVSQLIRQQSQHTIQPGFGCWNYDPFS